MKNKHLIFNTNMIIAGLTGSVIAGRIGAVFKFGHHELTIFIVSVLHFVFAFIIFTSLYYATNRKKYKTYFCKRIWIDFAKIYGTFIPSLIIFYVLFFAVNDIMLHQSISVTISSISAWAIGTLVSRIIHTFLAHRAGVFRD